MKFAIAVVMLALAISASASVLPLPWATTLGVASPWASPYTLGNPWASPITYSNPWAVAPSWAPSRIAVSHGINPISYSVPIARVAAPIVAAAPIAQASYVAANRGSVHVAPLPGHIQSVSSSNLEPAAGTL